MNLVSVIVSTTVMGIIMPGVLQVSIAPLTAALRSNNFAEAESKATSFVALANNSYELPSPIPDGCTVNEQDQEIECIHGIPKYRMTARRSYVLLSQGSASGGLGVYSDDDLDGFDDVTGLFTHYAECYSGWKGSGTLKNNCDLGGQYVIPAYAELYQ